jgi:hypothetical protein
MKTYKFSELSATAKIKAAKDYKAGWYDETNEDRDLDDCIAACHDNEGDFNYTINGELIDCEG